MRLPSNREPLLFWSRFINVNCSFNQLEESGMRYFTNSRGTREITTAELRTWGYRAAHGHPAFEQPEDGGVRIPVCYDSGVKTGLWHPENSPCTLQESQLRRFLHLLLLLPISTWSCRMASHLDSVTMVRVRRKLLSLVAHGVTAAHSSLVLGVHLKRCDLVSAAFVL